ncbi:LuxR C-terminal-related transcriptional regulator [Halomonas chromatireducens]|uniref:Nitrate/nitrite response regulator protein NarL n=1 Tax=Halomonas chromatireducens TaxID=507626 RepID=A0A120JW31_9GAMM|nr:response regulator transcription factor [Halomonas chromatireducens]AMD01026.1 Nitrate/nitrite response regulator protein NarL [Halomonas chromatireducens]
MAHFFVCHGRDEIPRWRMAFPESSWVGPTQALEQVGRGDLAWVMSNLDGWDTLVRDLGSRGAVLVVLSYSPAPEEASRALNAGARGYAHALSPAVLLQQVALVTTNQGIWVLPELLNSVVAGTFKALGGHARMNGDSLSALTERERTVALAVAEGKSNKVVARELDITERTVKAHLGAIFRKLGVRDRMQLILQLAKQEAKVLDMDQ